MTSHRHVHRHLVAVGGALGSLARYGLAGIVNSRAHPWGTVTVNIVGSLVLGILIGIRGQHPDNSGGGVGSSRRRSAGR